MINHSVYVYVDDILIFSPDLVTHKQVVREVLLRLLKNRLFVKAEKCEFHSSFSSFPGLHYLRRTDGDGPEQGTGDTGLAHSILTEGSATLLGVC